MIESMFKSHVLNDKPVDDSWKRILFDAPETPDHKLEEYISTLEHNEPLVLMSFVHWEHRLNRQVRFK